MHCSLCISNLGLNVVDFSKTASSVISDAPSMHSQQRSNKNTSFDNFSAAEQTGLGTVLDTA